MRPGGTSSHWAGSESISAALASVGTALLVEQDPCLLLALCPELRVVPPHGRVCHWLAHVQVQVQRVIFFFLNNTNAVFADEDVDDPFKVLRVDQGII